MNNEEFNESVHVLEKLIAGGHDQVAISSALILIARQLKDISDELAEANYWRHPVNK